MDDATLMGGVERAACLPGQVERPFRFEGSSTPDALSKVLTLDVFHDDTFHLSFRACKAFTLCTAGAGRPFLAEAVDRPETWRSTTWSRGNWWRHAGARGVPQGRGQRQKPEQPERLQRSPRLSPIA